MALKRQQATENPVPDDIREALADDGVLTTEQVKTLIEIEARDIGLTYDEAYEAFKNWTLPNTEAGIEIRHLFRLMNCEF